MAKLTYHACSSFTINLNITQKKKKSAGYHLSSKIILGFLALVMVLSSYTWVFTHYYPMSYTTKYENSVIASTCSTHAVMKNLTLFGGVKQIFKHAPSLKFTECIKHSWRKECNREEKSNAQALHFHHMNHCTLSETDPVID